MKLLLDFLPLLLFFGSFKYADAHKDWAAVFASEHFGFMVSGGKVGAEEAPVLLATLVVIIATLLQVLVLKARRQKVDLILWISLALVTVLGGATIWFHDDTFIKWKPTGLYWASSLVFWASNFFWGKNLIRAMLGKELTLPDPVWLTLNRAWVGFFGFLGVLNLYVAYNFDRSTWVDFKAFGTTGLIIVFTVAQGFYLSRHLDAADEAQAKADDAQG